MTTGVIKWFDSDNSEFAIVEHVDTNKLIILDTKSINLPIDYLTTGDKIRFTAQLSPFGPIAKELVKI